MEAAGNQNERTACNRRTPIETMGLRGHGKYSHLQMSCMHSPEGPKLQSWTSWGSLKSMLMHVVSYLLTKAPVEQGCVLQGSASFRGAAGKCRQTVLRQVFLELLPRILRYRDPCMIIRVQVQPCKSTALASLSHNMRLLKDPPAKEP